MENCFGNNRKMSSLWPHILDENYDMSHMTNDVV